MLKNPSAKYAVSGPVANPLLGGDIAPVDGSVEGPTHGEIEGGLAKEELEVGEKSPQDEVLIPVPVPVPRSVDLNLFEKVWMLLEFCQLHSLLLVASFQFWPPRYLEVMKGLAAAVNLDFVLWRQEFFMEWRGFEGKYKDYAMMMCIAPALVYGSFRVLEGRFRLGRRLLFMRLEAAVVMVLDFLLLPLLLAFSRLFQCVPVSNIKAVTWTIEYESFDGMEVDREAECAGSDYWFAAFVVGLTCLGVAKFLLSFYYRSTVTATTYKSQIDHSKMMVRFELEWMLGLGEDWAWGGMWSISSWERRGRWWRSYWVLGRYVGAKGGGREREREISSRQYLPTPPPAATIQIPSHCCLRHSLRQSTSPRSMPVGARARGLRVHDCPPPFPHHEQQHLQGDP